MILLQTFLYYCQTMHKHLSSAFAYYNHHNHADAQNMYNKTKICIWLTFLCCILKVDQNIKTCGFRLNAQPNKSLH